MDRRHLRHLYVILGDIAWYRRGDPAVQIEADIGRVLGPGPATTEIRAVARQSLRSYFRNALEVLYLPLDPERLSAVLLRTSVSGEDRLRAIRVAGRGAVLAAPRMGNWEYAVAVLAASFDDVVVVASGRASSALRYALGGLGVDIAAASDSDQADGGNIVSELVLRLRDGAIVCLISDDEANSRGVDVSFLGSRSKFPGGPAALALRSGAALIPVSTWFEPSGWGVRVHEEIAVPAVAPWKVQVAQMTQQLAHLFEAEIRQHPQDWHPRTRIT